MTDTPQTGAIGMEQLTESHRFDSDMAALLTRFEYQKDEISLTAAAERPLPAGAYTADTTGLEAVFDAGSSLVFVCYDDSNHQMVNPIESLLVQSIAKAVSRTDPKLTDGGSAGTVGDEPAVTATDVDSAGSSNQSKGESAEPASGSTTSPSLGVVTPHNAQRGLLETVLPETVTPNTVEKYQGGERDIMAVCGTVSDPEFARSEDRFILSPNRLLVAISRSRLLTVVVCSNSLFEVAPQTSDNLDNGPVWARLFTTAVGQNPEPTWSGSLGEFTGSDSRSTGNNVDGTGSDEASTKDDESEYSSIRVAVYST